MGNKTFGKYTRLSAGWKETVFHLRTCVANKILLHLLAADGGAQDICQRGQNAPLGRNHPALSVTLPEDGNDSPPLEGLRWSFQGRRLVKPHIIGVESLFTLAPF